MLKIRPLNLIFLIECVLVVSAGNAFAQSAGPQPWPMPAPIAAPTGHPVSGHDPLERRRDRYRAAHLPRSRDDSGARAASPSCFCIRSGCRAITPPRARIDKLAGLMIHANGKRLEWTRDPVDVFAFHVEVPGGRGGARRRIPIRLAG